MGRKSDSLCWYLGKAEVFADFCNGSIYGGRCVITPQELAEGQRSYSGSRRRRSGKRIVGSRERDVMKLLCRGAHFVKIAVENQDRLRNYSAFGFIVTESAHLKSPTAMGQILSWLYSDVLTVFAASAKTWLNCYQAALWHAPALR